MTKRRAARYDERMTGGFQDELELPLLILLDMLQEILAGILSEFTEYSAKVIFLAIEKYSSLRKTGR